MLFGGPVNERYLPEILPLFFLFPFFFISAFPFFVVFPCIVFVCTCVGFCCCCFYCFVSSAGLLTLSLSPQHRVWRVPPG